MKNLFKAFAALGMAITLLVLTALPVFAAQKQPDLSSGSFVDLLPYMKESTYGKQSDELDGKRLTVKKGKEGYTAVYHSQAVNYGLRFNYDFVKPEGTLYTSCVLDAKQDLWDSDNARIYGGPVVELGYGLVTHTGVDYNGYFSLLFTEQDGIDLRFSDKIGNDLVYLGAITSGLKVDYPDTKSKKRGKNNYHVVTAMSKKAITVWVNGTEVISNVQFGKLFNSSGNKINCVVERFSPGMHANATRTTIHNFRLYCSKTDAIGVQASSGETSNSSKTSSSSSKTSSSSSKTSSGSSKTSSGSSKTSSNSSKTSSDSNNKSYSDKDNTSAVDDISDGFDNIEIPDQIEDSVENGDSVTLVGKEVVLVRGEKVNVGFKALVVPLTVLGVALIAGATFVAVYILVTKKKSR